MLLDICGQTSYLRKTKEKNMDNKRQKSFSTEQFLPFFKILKISVKIRTKKFTHFVSLEGLNLSYPPFSHSKGHKLPPGRTLSTAISE